MTDRKEWLKPYRDIIDQQFQLTPGARQDVDAFFSRLEQKAAECSSQAAFATAFMESPMYQEYTNLFTKYSKMVTTATGETAEEATKTMKKQAAKSAATGYVSSMANQEVNIAVSHMLPDEINQLRWGGLRAIPIIGPIVQWIDNIEWIRRILKK